MLDTQILKFVCTYMLDTHTQRSNGKIDNYVYVYMCKYCIISGVPLHNSTIHNMLTCMYPCLFVCSFVTFWK